GARRSDGLWTGWWLFTWTDLTRWMSAEEIAKYDAIDCGVCVRTGLVDGVDMDIEDAQLVEAVEQAALDLLGPAPCRGRSNSAKRLLPYRSQTPHKKITLELGTAGKVEILGAGQQFIATGTHPSGVPYKWARGDLCKTGLAGLTPVTREQID